MMEINEFIDDLHKYELETCLCFKVIRDKYSCANGCGANIKFPSTMWCVNIEAACILHDLEWSQAWNYSDLLLANERFDNNLKLICDYESGNKFMRWLRRLRIAKYVIAVELVGTSAYAEKRGFE